MILKSCKKFVDLKNRLIRVFFSVSFSLVGGGGVFDFRKHGINKRKHRIQDLLKAIERTMKSEIQFYINRNFGVTVYTAELLHHLIPCIYNQNTRVHTKTIRNNMGIHVDTLVKKVNLHS